MFRPLRELVEEIDKAIYDKTEGIVKGLSKALLKRYESEFIEGVKNGSIEDVEDIIEFIEYMQRDTGISLEGLDVYTIMGEEPAEWELYYELEKELTDIYKEITGKEPTMF